MYRLLLLLALVIPVVADGDTVAGSLDKPFGRKRLRRESALIAK